MHHSLRGRGDRVFDALLHALLVAVLIAMLLPLWSIVVTSVMPLGYAGGVRERLLLSPLDWTFAAYSQLLGQASFLRATLNSLVITGLGLATNMVLTVLTAFGLSRRGLPGRNLLTMLILFTFLFNAGLVPTYLLVKDLKLLNSYGALILPGAISVYNLFVVRAFFQNLPEGLEEAAKIDGANELQVLWHILLPLSKPILLTVGLFYAVGHWNDFFNPILYLSDDMRQPLPVLLRNILVATNFAEYVEPEASRVASQESLKMAAVILATLPMLVVYPWIQRYFTKGVLVGGIKE